MSDVIRPYYERSDADLITWANAFVSIVQPQPTTWGLSAPFVLQLSEVNDTWQARFVTATTPATRTKLSVAAKSESRREFLAIAREAVRLINATVTVTDLMKLELDIPIRKTPERRNAPTLAPVVETGERSGHGVWIDVHAPDSLRRALVPDAAGIQTYYYVGAQASENADDWIFVGTQTRRKVLVEFPASLPAGTRVWIACNYYNARGTGPGSLPVTTVLAGGGGVARVAALKIAA